MKCAAAEKRCSQICEKLKPTPPDAKDVPGELLIEQKISQRDQQLASLLSQHQNSVEPPVWGCFWPGYRSRAADSITMEL